jgi:hypothetical protein
MHARDLANCATSGNYLSGQQPFSPHDLEDVDVHDLFGFFRDNPETCFENPFLADLAAIEYVRSILSAIISAAWDILTGRWIFLTFQGNLAYILWSCRCLPQAAFPDRQYVSAAFRRKL